MKINSIIKRVALAISITGLFCNITVAQDQSQAQGKSEATIELSYYKKADMSKTAVATVKIKKDKKFLPAKNTRINFYVAHDKEQQLLKSVNTDNNGQAVLVLKKDLPLGEDHSFTILAKIENDKMCENAEEQIHFKEANLTLNVNPHDTSRTVTAKVTEMDNDGKEVAVKGIELKFYVQRLFGIMPAAEENTVSTDEKGEASFVYPKNIPGDTAGIFNVTVRMEDNEKYGNVESKAATSWGTPLAILKEPFPRALWEPRAPWAMIITLAILYGIVWSSYCFIIVQLREIKKEGKEISKN